MRVLHVISSLEFGGAEKVLVDLVNAMVERCDSGVCCVKRGGELEAALDRRVHLYRLNKGEGNHAELPWELARLARDGNYDVIHSHTWSVYVESALAALIARSRVLVHTVHGHYITYPPGVRAKARIFVRHAAERALARAHRKIVTVSDAIQAYVRSEIGIPTHRMMTIHNGVNEAEMGARKNPSTDAVTFITVGRLAAVKNYPMLLQAFAAILLDHPRCMLQIVGEGTERAALERLAGALGISGNVLFPGFQRDVSRWLVLADVFVLSSHYEGISIALLEAMRAGLPVIGTQVGGMAEVVLHGKTGLLVADGDVLAMSRAMRSLVSKPAERHAMGAAGHAYMHREFSMSSAAEKYFTLYST